MKAQRAFRREGYTLGERVKTAENGVFEAFEAATASASPSPSKHNHNSAPSSPRRKTARLVKRSMDVALAVPLAVFLTPIFVLLAIAIKLDSPGPVLFRQTRHGRRMRPFTIFKFRTLRHKVADPHHRYRMLAQDSRITRVGGFLRRTSLDELPQLLNVIGSSMSMVGPRPLVEWESRASLRTHPERFEVKPGITGLCQTRFRNWGETDIRWDCDVEYVRNWSPLLDLKILLKTPSCVLRGEKIYPSSR